MAMAIKLLKHLVKWQTVKILIRLFLIWNALFAYAILSETLVYDIGHFPYYIRYITSCMSSISMFVNSNTCCICFSFHKMLCFMFIICDEEFE